MLRNLKELFASLTETPARDQGGPSEHTLQLATAVLLIEVMRTDANIDRAERETTVAVLREQFGLSDDELERLLELAGEKASEAPDFYAFTSQLNKGYDAAEKVRIVEYLWRVAFADGHLSHHEQHLLRKIADLLYLKHGDYIAAKQRAREALGLPPAQ